MESTLRFPFHIKRIVPFVDLLRLLNFTFLVGFVLVPQPITGVLKVLLADVSISETRELHNFLPWLHNLIKCFSLCEPLLPDYLVIVGSHLFLSDSFA